MKTCPYCNGTGREGFWGGKCSQCDGTARVPNGLQPQQGVLKWLWCGYVICHCGAKTPWAKPTIGEMIELKKPNNLPDRCRSCGAWFT